jgi:hypothetical protein
MGRPLMLSESTPNSEHDALHSAIGGVLFNVMNFPEKVQARLLGQDMGPLREKLADAVLAAGYRPQDEVKAEVLEEVASEFNSRLPDGTGNGRAYNSYTVARMLIECAAKYRDGKQS